ncbi:hypothetical protein I302_107253 [Kwoniella bestiolae CBS 10118]|uniref:Histone acetyltransferase n=1 Tax=Kwoniella bestiolae CBS 10118 TaxID=1296100 RepID=A0A1B9FZ39_9TREE|nr:hypothetical protein I302_07011 [Kwoniella bestiolae CBS 10118]OCF24025.1 hypothetical protein I302_07011 [Kwoniella bestiolae CBS 10118]
MRTPTRSSSKPLSVRSGVSRTPSKLPPPSPTPQHVSNDIPIDPALLQDEDDMEDAEGELVDEELDMIHYTGQDHHHHHHHHQLNATASSSTSSNIYSHIPAPMTTPRIDIFTSSNGTTTPIDMPSPRKRARVARSSTSVSLSTPGPNGDSHTHGQSRSRPSSSSKPPRNKPNPNININGKGKGKGKQIVARETICSFCGGTDQINKLGQKELMVSCSTCGRSGHPSCLNMTHGPISKRVMTYDWQCIECKTCEFCKVKGDDSRLMFCDTCDRGWHSYCLVPALAKPPKGSWYCPRCVSESSPLPSSSSRPTKHPPTTTSSSSRKAISALLDTTSVSTPTARPKKARARNTSEVYGEEDLPSSSQRIKVKLPKSLSASERRKKRGDTEDDEGTPMIVRLKLPNKNSNKEEAVAEPEEIPEEEKVPYGGIITGQEADTSKTEIIERDKEEFERSRKLAENKLGGPPPTLSSSTSLELGFGSGSPGPTTPSTPGPSKSTPLNTPTGVSRMNSSSAASLSRPLRDRLLQQSVSLNDTSSPASGFPFPSTPHLHHPPKEDTGKLEKINKIRFGQFDIDTWYSAPYPEEYVYVPDGRLWLCEFCLKYMKSGFVAGRHRLKCKVRHPPGDEIYRDGAVSVFEVDGRKNKIYCQNLCLLAKMFLDHKTLYYDVEPFLFYVMTEVDDLGARFVGYFSKEKRSLDNNVSCIMTLPVRQRKGWGQLLIDFSYLLSKKEGRVGSPEKPLSGLGAVTYKGYWKLAIFRYLLAASPNVTMDDISLATSITLEDIYSVLTSEDMITLCEPTPSAPSSQSLKTPRSRNSHNNRVRKKPPTSPQQDDKDVKIPLPFEYSISIDLEYIRAVVKKNDEKGYLVLKAERLKYHPFLVTRNPTLTTEQRTEATLKIIGQSANTVNDNGINGGSSAEQEETPLPEPPTEEEIIKGKDQATLNLVAELSQSPARSLRRKRDESSASLSVSPMKSFRSRNGVGVDSPSNRNGRELRGNATLPAIAPSSFNGSPTKSVEDHLPILRKASSLNGSMSSRSRRRIIMSSDTEEEEEEVVEMDRLGGGDKLNGNGDGNESVRDDVNVNGGEKVHMKNSEDGMVQGKEQTTNVDVFDEQGNEEDAEGEDEDAEGEDDEEYFG